MESVDVLSEAVVTAAAAVELTEVDSPVTDRYSYSRQCGRGTAIEQRWTQQAVAHPRAGDVEL